MQLLQCSATVCRTKAIILQSETEQQQVWMRRFRLSIAVDFCPGFRSAAAAVEAFVELLLAAAAADPQQVASAELVNATSDGAIAIFGEAVMARCAEFGRTQTGLSLLLLLLLA